MSHCQRKRRLGEPI
ncbi:hypothetical protein RSAG8_00177, partial [Rhizoctonia solani AG-8 WAC10335]